MISRVTLNGKTLLSTTQFSEQFIGWDIYEINTDRSNKELACFYSFLRVVCASYQTKKKWLMALLNNLR